MVHLNQEIQYAQNEGIAAEFYIAFSIAFFL